MNYLRIRQAVIDQRSELEKVFLSEKIIPRENLKIYGELLDSDQIKVITGPRRAGKSIFCLQLLQGREFAYINFDDENLASLRKEDLNLVLKAFYEIHGKPEYLFLDEVQNIEGWELFVNRLKRSGFNIIVTGSNARLLSRELATHLTGRHFALELFPFSFREFLDYSGFDYVIAAPTTEQIALIMRELERYISIGGFPETYKESDPRRYLSSLYSAILTRDILLRHRVKYIKALREISHYLLTNFSCRMTFNKLKNIFGFNSVHTAQNYFSFLEESYLIFQIEKFSFKIKEKSTAPRKVYAIDTGLVHSLPGRLSPDRGSFYENIVAVELLRRRSHEPDLEIYYWQDYSGREVDFVLKRGPAVVELIQVCLDLEDYDVRARELKSLVSAGKELSCSEFLIINSEKSGIEKFRGKAVRLVPLWRWLLEEKK
ncbi:MAG: ATP-binding protein [Candidatus Aminicenantales bacterium]